MMVVLPVYGILTVILLHCTADGLQYIVVPQDGGRCNGEALECNDLSYYARQSDVYFTSDTILTFLPGIHILDYSGPIVISDVNNLTLQGNGSIEDGFHWTVKQSDVVISCNGSTSGFLVKNFDGVAFSGLTITNCGFSAFNVFHSYIQLPLISRFSAYLHTMFSLLTLNGTNLLVEQVSIQNGTGYGLCCINVYMNLVVASSSFSRNNIDCSLDTMFGGNIGILYLDLSSCPASLSPSSNTSVVISNASFSFGKSCAYFASLNPLRNNSQGGGGLALSIFSLKCGRPLLAMEDVTMIGNEGRIGSSMAYYGYPIDMYINRLNCLEGKDAAITSGLWILLEFGSPDYSSELRITNSYFIGNKIIKDAFGTASAFLLLASVPFYDQITLSNCYFSGNEGTSVVRFEQNNFLITDSSRVVLSNVTIHGSSGFNSRGAYDFVGALVLVNTACSVTNLNVSDNPLSGIHLVHSSMSFGGVNHIQNNSFTNGGGIALTGLSTIYLHPSTILNFIDNHATDYGGAIYVADDPGKTYLRPCFYQIKGLSGLFQLASPDIVINAINNTAGRAGDFLNGGNLEVCYYAALYSSKLRVLSKDTGLQYFLTLIQPFVSSRDNFDFISINPAGVVVCNAEGVFNTTLRVLHDPPFYFIPGKLFNISLATINTQIGISPGNIVASIYNCSSDTSTCLKEEPLREIFAESPNKCFNMSIVITADKYTTRLIIKFATLGEIPYDAFSPLYVTFEPKDCPPGFTRTDICECNEFVKSTGAMCNINTTSISTNGSVWISYDSTSNTTLYSYDCPIGYCVNEPVTFNILEPDAQCAYNRSGILCGECAEGYSLLLGSNECGECPNNDYLSLLLVFGIAGILLVVLLILLNLTVSVGTINGLIFYANIVKINEQVFLPFRESHPVVLRQFISFMNLDFGIQTCFYNGMTAYMKAWLQFVFPLYIWLIMIVVMLLSRRFMKLARVIGNNAVKVFATLLLLSYTKIIREIGVVLSVQKYYSNEEELLGWRSDSNVAVSGLSEANFIVVRIAAIVMIVLVLPYTIFLISLPFIEKVFAKLRWKFLWLKPFADAYSGPFKHRRQFWIGLLLIYRVLFIALTGSDLSWEIPVLVNVLFIIVLLNIMALIYGLYEKYYLNVLELWFLSNLLAISMVALTHKEFIVYVGVVISITFVLITFFGICVFHFVQQGRHWFCKKKNNEKECRLSNPSGPSQNSVSLNNVKEVRNPRAASYNDIDLRESLLEDTNILSL